MQTAPNITEQIFAKAQDLGFLKIAITPAQDLPDSDDALQNVQPQRLNVSSVGEVRVGHDGGRIGVGQDHPVPLLPEDTARLGAGVVELASLPYHDWPGADQQD